MHRRHKTCGQTITVMYVHVLHTSVITVTITTNQKLQIIRLKHAAQLYVCFVVHLMVTMVTIKFVSYRFSQGFKSGTKTVTIKSHTIHYKGTPIIRHRSKTTLRRAYFFLIFSSSLLSSSSYFLSKMSNSCNENLIHSATYNAHTHAHTERERERERERAR